MIGIYVEDTMCIPYSRLLACGYKAMETRTRDVLKSMPKGEQIAIISTRKGRKPMVVGFCRISDGYKVSAESWESYRKYTLIPEGSKYDLNGKPFKVGYWIYEPVAIVPYPLPDNKVNHGRSWCEFNDMAREVTA